MKLYHRTNAATAILQKGFKDGIGTYMTTIFHSGVWLSNYPLDCNEGAFGDTVLLIEIPESVIAEYEWIEEGKPYREFLVPAIIVNQYGPPRIFNEFEEY